MEAIELLIIGSIVELLQMSKYPTPGPKFVATLSPWRRLIDRSLSDGPGGSTKLFAVPRNEWKNHLGFKIWSLSRFFKYQGIVIGNRRYFLGNINRADY